MCMLGKGQKVEVKQLMQLSGWAPIMTFLDGCPESVYMFIFYCIFPLMLRKNPQEFTHFPTLETKLNSDLGVFIEVSSAKSIFFCWW